MPLTDATERRMLEMAERQVLISFDDLDKIEISCECGTGIVISALKSAPQLSTSCPGCQKSIHAAGTAVHAFRDFFAAAKQFTSDGGKRMEFRIREQV